MSAVEMFFLLRLNLAKENENYVVFHAWASIETETLFFFKLIYFVRDLFRSACV